MNKIHFKPGIASMKPHTTFRQHPDGSIDLIEVSICRDDDPDFRVEEPDGSVLYRISGSELTIHTEATDAQPQRSDEA